MEIVFLAWALLSYMAAPTSGSPALYKSAEDDQRA
jgi:hypothetical protein